MKTGLSLATLRQEDDIMGHRETCISGAMLILEGVSIERISFQMRCLL